MDEELNFTQSAETVFNSAKAFAKEYGHTAVGVEHLFIAILRTDNAIVGGWCDRAKVDLPKLRQITVSTFESKNKNQDSRS